MVRQVHAQSELRCIVAGRCVEGILAQFSDLCGRKTSLNLKVKMKTLAYRIFTSTEFSFGTFPRFFSACLSVCLSVRPSVCICCGHPGSRASQASPALGCCQTQVPFVVQQHSGPRRGLTYTKECLDGSVTQPHTHVASLPVWLHERNLTSELSQEGSCCTLSPDGGRGFVKRTYITLFWSCGGRSLKLSGTISVMVTGHLTQRPWQLLLTKTSFFISFL